MSNEFELIIRRTPTLSVSLPESDKLSLDHVQLHELSILRVLGDEGPVPITFIRMYFNKKYTMTWTDEQILRVWQGMRTEIRKDPTIPKGHPLLLWDRTADYRDGRFPPEKVELLDEIVRTTREEFQDTLGSELNDSSIGIDLEIEQIAFDDISIVTSIEKRWAKVPRGWTRDDRKLFSHDEGPTWFKHPNSQRTTDDNVDEFLKLKALAEQYSADYKEWMSLATSERATMANMPKTSDPKYKYTPQLPKSLVKKER
ncbi:MAG: hypothetical protein Q9224_006325 [Gallowayella concinna]